MLFRSKEKVKDGYYYVYYLPEEHYIGVTGGLTYRKYSHKSNGRYINDIEIVFKTPNRKLAYDVEKKLHNMGYEG